MPKWILGLGIIIVFLLIILGFSETLNWAIVGVLSTVTIGIVGWIINYLSKSGEKTIRSESVEKKLEKPKQAKIIVEETCRVDKKEYVYHDLDLNAKETVRGEITSDEAINIYFLTKHGFRFFENDEEFSYEYGAESIFRKKISFEPSTTSTWYLVIENQSKDPATVNINLFV